LLVQYLRANIYAAFKAEYITLSDTVTDAGEYWDSRFKTGGRIWGDHPSKSAYLALELFRKEKVKSILVPGSGYGRNSRLFSTHGFKVTGFEISPVACEMAITFDPETRLFNDSVLDMSADNTIYDAVYCFNVLHLFREEQRKLMVQQCIQKVKKNGLMFFTVFSEREKSYGKNRMVEWNTFESKPGRPVHYFTEQDLNNHFPDTEILDTGLIDDPEDHGEEGPHVHRLRYIYLSVKK
jgi:SAM-dependent methyltransferase